MPFGLKNTAQTFQRMMNSILQALDYVYCYINDILIASETAEQHEHHLREVLRRLQRAGITINSAKCKLGEPEIKFLGYFVSAEGIRPLPDKVKAIQQYLKPKTVVELRGFLEMANYYQRCLKHAAHDQSILNEYLRDSKKKDKRPVTWTSEVEQAFKRNKQAIIEAIILSHPQDSAPLLLTTDASDTAIGASLEQIIDGKHNR